MKIGEIVAKVAMNTGMKPGDLMKAVDDIFTGVKTTVERGEKVAIAGLGAFVLKSRKAGEKTNSKTGEKHTVEAGSFIAFKPLNAAKKDKAERVKADRVKKEKT